jgi:hypothetical protein
MIRGILFIWGVLIVICIGLVASHAMAQDTNMNMKYSGQPVPSAIAPSMSAFSQDVCGIPVSGAIQSTVIGVSGGSVYMDANCINLKWAKFFNDAGLKVTAVAVACSANVDNWYAMEMSGTPCPIGGAVGDSARQAWYKLYPERFEKLYGKDFKLPAIADSKPDNK